MSQDFVRSAVHPALVLQGSASCGSEMGLEGLCTRGVSLSLQKELQERQSQVGVSPINCEHHRIVLFVHGAGAELIKTHVTTPARRHSRLHSLYWLGF